MIAYSLGKRQATMDLALSRLPADPWIVETGCAYNPGDWEGAGLSTIVFGEHVASNGWLSTVDIDEEHLQSCREMTSQIPSITYHHGDSVEFLTHFGGPIDLLYLDSLDYPYGTLLELYGGKTDLNAAIAALDALTEDEVVERHGPIIAASQEHCERELRAALPWLTGMVLIDDAALPGGGKARLAKRVLEAEGFTPLLDGYQTLWAR